MELNELNKGNILDYIIEIGRLFEDEDKKQRTCPKCKHYPIEVWAICGFGLRGACPKCGWKDGFEFTN